MKWLLALAWFSAAATAGYFLAERSFSFLKDPLPFLDALAIDPQELRDKLPQEGEDPASWYESLPAETRACLRAALGEEAFAAALAGRETVPTTEQAVKAALCLK